MKVNVVSNIGLGLASVCFCLMLSSCSGRPEYPEPVLKGSNVAIDADDLGSGVPVFYTHRSGGKNINFFVVKIDKKVLSFLDACMTCYHRKRGYSHEKGRLVCRACGMEYNVSKIENGLGGCFPIKIEGRLKGRDYLIPVSTLDAAADKF